MGKKGSSVKPSPYEDQLSNIAKDMLTQTAPMRGNLINEMTAVSAGDYDPAKSPMFAPMFAQGKQGVESQYGLAKENILSNVPRGGAQVTALADLEQGRAEQASSLPSMISQDIMTDMLNKTYGTAFAAPQQSMSGLSSASASYGSRAAAAQQASSAQQGALFQALGFMGGMALGGPPGAAAGAAATSGGKK